MKNLVTQNGNLFLHAKKDRIEVNVDTQTLRAERYRPRK